MTSSDSQVIRSAANAQLKDLRRLAQDSGTWRKQGQVWLEGDHLCRAALGRGLQPVLAVCAESYWPQARIEWARLAAKVAVIADPLFASISGLESPARMAFVMAVPQTPELEPSAPTVVLDRLQDAGNVGAILRSAAAFGFRQVITMKGTAGLWSPKVVRAGMGAHFALALIDGAEPAVLEALSVPLLTTSSHGGVLLHQAGLPWPCAWVLGHEGQGVAPEIAARAALAVRIAQPGGEESLNVASAAAICLHASSTTAIAS